MQNMPSVQSEEKQYYTWQQFDEDCVRLAKWAQAKDIKTLYGIPRGGLIVAVKVSHLLNIPMVVTKDDVTRQTLVVDDIVDTGDTIERLVTAIGSHFLIASLFWSAQASHTPDWHARTKEAWIVFPWETEATSKYDHTELI